MTSPRMIMRRYGGSAQLRITNFAELLLALELPDVHWAVLSCPCTGLDCDERFLNLIDADNDQRISVLDLKKAIKWSSERLVDNTDFTHTVAEVKLERLTELAAPLKQTALTILDNLGVSEKSSITLEQVRKRDAILKHSGKNGDGVISIECQDDGPIKQALIDISACVTQVEDRSGKAGVNKELLNSFKAARDKIISMDSERDQQMHWGDGSVKTAQIVTALNDEICAWFRLGDLHAVNPDIADAFIKKQGSANNARDAEAIEQALSAQLINDNIGATLQFDKLRPTDSGKQFQTIRETCFPNSDGITLNDWQACTHKAQGILAWQDTWNQNPCSKLSIERLQALNDTFLADIEALCDKDAELADDIKHIDDLERLLLCKRWLLPFANNFVSLPYLFEHDKRAMFEQGSLLIGGRAFHLAVRVQNRKEHIKLSSESGMCVCYIHVAGDIPKREFEVAVPVTAGTRAGLFVGRRGVFHDTDGIILEAKIVHIIDNPVSISEAIMQPFTRIAKFISGKIENWSSSADKNFEKQVGDVLSDKPVQTKVAAAPAQSSFGSTLMGGSVAFAALGSSLAFITKQLSELQIHKIILGLAIIIALIMIPTAIVAFLKIRKRNLSALLQASEWAINDRMLLGYKLSKLLSNKPALPAGAVSEQRDQLERILKNVVLEDEDAQDFHPWAMLASVLCIGLGGAQTAHMFFDSQTPIGLLITTVIVSCTAMILGYKAWRKHYLRLLCLCILVLASITALVLPYCCS